MELSNFGRKFSADSGISRLMDDLGAAMSGSDKMHMLGGGNPAHILSVERCFRERMRHLLDDSNRFERAVGEYDGPQGNVEFISSLASLLHNELGWPVNANNIAITNGSQNAFFILFNMFAGEAEDGTHKRILLPLAPEYIGYTDCGLVNRFFVAKQPQIDHLDEHLFKYRLDFENVHIGEDIGAICVSRPTNPTGNVLTDTEIEQLIALSRQQDVPLIVDSAYGTPFPNIIFTDATPVWNDGIIVTMSLSKLGLPGVRTGIVIANEEIIRALSGINAVLSLATGSFGPALMLDLVRSGEILDICKKHIRPYYERKAHIALQSLRMDLDGIPFCVHKPEGAIFLWLWFPELPITSEELYQRLKARKVLVIAGHHFFPGIGDDWRHQQECIRVTYSQHEHTVREGIRIIADEVKRAYDGAAPVARRA